MIGIEFKPTDRGFQRGEFRDLYGNQCSIQKSSLATQDALWLGCEDLIQPPEGGAPFNRRMHLTQDMAAELIVLLQRFVDTGELTP